MKHGWEEVARRFTPGTNSIKGEILMSEHLLERLIRGVTVVEMRHKRTGKIKFIEQIGDQRSTPSS